MDLQFKQNLRRTTKGIVNTTKDLEDWISKTGAKIAFCLKLTRNLQAPNIKNTIWNDTRERKAPEDQSFQVTNQCALVVLMGTTPPLVPLPT
jgi:hypothetical protein